VINIRNMLDAGGLVFGYASPLRSYPDSMDRARSGIPDDIWLAMMRMAVDVEEANADSDYLAAGPG
jgi:hypothetical protein